MNIKVSIFTPAYNRAHTLKRCYESILVQKNLEQIEWIVVNDGSIDDTDLLMEEIIGENKLNIVYLKQENKGKQASWNRAVLIARGEFFIGLDSDDALQGNILFNILEQHQDQLQNNSIMGIRCLAINSINQKPSGKSISKKPLVLSWFDEFSNHNLFGERIDILRTSIIKNYLYPVNEKIRFIPEIWFYCITAHNQYKFIYSPKALRIFYDEEIVNRLSKSSIFTHADGHYISRALMLKLIPFVVWFRNPIALLKTIIRYSQVAKFLSKGFYERVKDTNLVFACFSYMLSPILSKV